MEEKNVFKDFINSLAQLDDRNWDKTREESRKISQDDPTQIFINRLARIYRINLSDQHNQFIVELVRMAEEISPNITKIISQSGYNILLLNEMWLYGADKKSIRAVIFQVFLYGVAFGRLHDNNS
ncbi:MAG: hypothetical protein ABIB55_01395 [Candidatus Nealsonbacteria bacterium]